MGFLVAPSEATKGMRDTMIRSKFPLGFVQISREGRISQMLWNHQASLWGLEGYGVTTKFQTRSNTDGGAGLEIVLTWDGKRLD